MDVQLDKEVFTTFEAAKICNANITSIKNWIDKGELRAFRTPGGHYRIERKVLRDFLDRHCMPNPFAERERKRVLLIHPHEPLLDELVAHLGKQHEYDACSEAHAALLTLGQWCPDVAVVHAGVDDLDALQLCETVAQKDELARMRIIVLHNRDEAYTESLQSAGAHKVISPADSTRALLETVRRALI